MTTEQSNQRFALYTQGRCAFCMYVMHVIRKLDLDVELRDVGRDPQHRQDLMSATGRSTVPVLRIAHNDGRDEWLPESRDIVRYLNSHHG